MSDPQIVTRFAPSPTGYLHIGGARTALFNWLFARANGGKFLLRIEDTDRVRSTPEATAAIFAGLEWLGLDWDEEATSQFERRDRHREVAQKMLANGSAYKCFSTKEEIEDYREQAKLEGRDTLFLSPWRDIDAADHPDSPYVVRVKAPREGGIAIKDQVHGKVSWKATSFDDMILLRSDGTPTYMHAVVVDDHDMGVTHIIRGDDHLINAGRQSLIYSAMGWGQPIFAHVPLIHGDDGKKLSKRHGALGVEEYRDMGYTAAAMRNYLTRLGWSHGNDELFTTEQAIEWFDLKGIGKAPARLDFKKLGHVSGFHIKNADDSALVADIEALWVALDRDPLTETQKVDLTRSMYCLKARAKTLFEIVENAHFILSSRPFKTDAAATQILDPVSRGILNRLTAALQHVTWTHEDLETAVKDFATRENLKLGEIAAPLRAALTGRKNAPSVFDMMVLIGQDETIARLEDTAR